MRGWTLYLRPFTLLLKYWLTLAPNRNAENPPHQAPATPQLPKEILTRFQDQLLSLLVRASREASRLGCAKFEPQAMERMMGWDEVIQGCVKVEVKLIGSMWMVYLPTWMADFYGKFSW